MSHQGSGDGPQDQQSAQGYAEIEYEAQMGRYFLRLLDLEGIERCMVELDREAVEGLHRALGEVLRGESLN